MNSALADAGGDIVVFVVVVVAATLFGSPPPFFPAAGSSSRLLFCFFAVMASIFVKTRCSQVANLFASSPAKKKCALKF